MNFSIHFMQFFKKIAVVLCLFSAVQSGFGQNLVPNPSFEDTVNCPFAAGDISKSTGWTSLCGSPDFFYSCNQFDWGCPNNIFGHQLPASGDGYSGFISYSDVMTNTREFPAIGLSSSLDIGTKYYVSFKVALSLESIANPTNCASDKLGALFTTGQYFCESNITNSPQIFTDSIITDSLNWTRITGSFIADSAYTYVAFGNFFDDVNTDTAKFFNSWWSDFAYYYLDDVCIGTDSAFVYNYDYTSGINENDLNNLFEFYPNPANEHIYINSSINSTFDLELFNAIGNKINSANNITSNQLKLNLSTFDSGLLIIKITTNQNQIIHKFIKQ